MRVFLSYASEYRDRADAIALTLRGHGHTVFFDRDDLPPGRTYDDEIARAVGRAHLFVFLLSPEALLEGRYTRSELNAARRRWPNPDGHVLPVLIAPTPREEIPNYLKAVTILEPTGSAAADVGAAVEAIARRRHRRAAALAGVATLLLVGATVAGIALMPTRTAEGSIDVVGYPAYLLDPGLFGAPARFSLRAEVSNRSEVTRHVEAFTIETRLPGQLQASLSPADDDELPVSVNPGKTGSLFLVGSAGSTMPDEARICWADAESDSDCGPWYPWAVRRNESWPPAPESIRASAHDAAAGPGGLFVLSGNPVQVTRFAGGAWGEPATLGEIPAGASPSAIAASGSSILVATHGPSHLVRLDISLLVGTGTAINLDALSGMADAFGDPVSSELESIAASDDDRWVKTGAQVGSAGLFAWHRGARGWGSAQIVPYNDEVAFDLTDLTLRVIDGKLWGVPRATTPSSLYRFTRDRWQTWTGHDQEILACATDVAPHPSGLIVLDCDNRLKVIQPADDGRVALLGDLGGVPAWPRTPDRWDWHLIAPNGDGAVVALNQETTHDAGPRELRTRVVSVQPWEVKGLLETDRAQARSMASVDGWAVIVLESSDGARDVVVVRASRP